MDKVNRIAVIGSAASGGALQIIDAISGSNQQMVVALFDSDASLKGTKILGVEVLDNSENVLSYYEKGLFDAVVIGIGGNLDERERIYNQMIKLNIPVANIIDKSAQVRTGAKMGSGNVILGGAYIGPNVILGNNCYILNHISIQHDSKIGDHCYIATGTIIGAYVSVGNKVRFEIASGAKSRIKVENDTVVSAGTILNN